MHWPRLAQRLLTLWSLLPPRSRLRRAWLARHSCRGVAAANRRDFDLLFLFLRPDIEYESFITDTSGAIFPDVIGVQRGHAMYRAIWAAIDDAYDNAKLEYDELIDLRDRVVILGRLHGRGRHTGIPVDQPISQVFTFERGLVVRQQDFAARERVIQAVGPSE